MGADRFTAVHVQCLKPLLTRLHRGSVLPSFPRACQALWMSHSGGYSEQREFLGWDQWRRNLNVPLHDTNTPARRKRKTINGGECLSLLSSCCFFPVPLWH